MEQALFTTELKRKITGLELVIVSDGFNHTETSMRTAVH